MGKYKITTSNMHEDSFSFLFLSAGCQNIWKWTETKLFFHISFTTKTVACHRKTTLLHYKNELQPIAYQNMQLCKIPHSYGIKYLIRSKPVDEINSLRDCLKYRANLTSYILCRCCVYDFTIHWNMQIPKYINGLPPSRKKWDIFN